MALTDAKIRSAKTGDKIRKLSDGKGLQLCLMPTGSKLWRWAYRYEGKQLTLSLGAYPTIGLSKAREEAARARGLLVSGIDPHQQKKADKRENANRKGLTFGLIADELLAKKKREGKAERTIRKMRWLFDLADPLLGSRPICELTAPDVLAALQEVEAKGRLDTASRMREVIGQVFRFAMATGRATINPTTALRGALTTPTVAHRAAITNAKDLGALLRAIDGFEGQPTTRACLQLMALLFPRPGELRLADWSEFDFVKGAWIIPAKRTKMRREHVCPLPPQAVAILEELRPITGHGALVFPGLRTARRPISENTMNAALRRMGFAQDQMSAHGFRASASTLLNESGKFSPDAIEAALAHQDDDAVRRAYARGAYWDERVRMATWWADHLDTLRRGAEVIPIATRVG